MMRLISCRWITFDNKRAGEWIDIPIDKVFISLNAMCNYWNPPAMSLQYRFSCETNMDIYLSKYNTVVPLLYMHP